MTASTSPHPVFDNPKMLIGGEWVVSGSLGQRAHLNPSTGKILGTFPVGGTVEVDRAIQAAQAAAPAWRALAPTARRDILLRCAEGIRGRAVELATIAAHETGAVFNPGGPARGAEHLIYYAGWADKIEGHTTPFGPGVFNYSLHEPYGIVAALTSWNGPVTSALMKLGAIFAAGNCVILKPPELGPFATLVLAEILLEAGVPPGVLNVVTGGVEAGASLVGDRRIGKISFTGGLPTARHVLRGAAEHATPVVMELGGKSANLVFSDADLDRAAVMSAQMGCMTHSGQGCLFPTRLLVEESVYEKMVEKVLAHTAKAKVGDPFAAGVTSGPVITESALQRITAAIDTAKIEKHGRLLTGGGRLGGELAEGYFIQPTVFGEVDNKSALAQQEVFGPVLSIMRFKDEADAIAKANDTAYGLAGYVHTKDLGRAHRVASALEAGYIGVNAFPPMPVQTPFGGYKQSGYGREGGRVGIEEFLRLKNVYMALG